MTTDLPLRCACGKLRGTALGVSPRTGTRVVCYCGDCQAFARFLGRTDIMDASGGTDIFQMPPTRLRITEGADALRCMRLSEKGLFRWYCGECKTPVGNTMPGVPFVGVITTFMDHTGGGRARDEALGKPIAHIQTKSALGAVPERGIASLVRFGARVVTLLAKWWVTGAGSPSPFFEEKTRAPRAEVRVLTAEERRAL